MRDRRCTKGQVSKGADPESVIAGQVIAQHLAFEDRVLPKHRPPGLIVLDTGECLWMPSRIQCGRSIVAVDCRIGAHGHKKRVQPGNNNIRSRDGVRESKVCSAELGVALLFEDK